MPEGADIPQPKPISGFATWMSRIVPALVVTGVMGMIYVQDNPLPWDEPMDLSYKLLDEFAPRSLSDFRGRVMVVNLWATWCQPCRQELIELNALQQKYERDGLMIVAVSDEDAETVGRFAGLDQIRFTVGVLDSLAASTVPTTRPYTFILDRDGKVRHKFRGVRSLADFERAVKPLL
jgi:peroxiredoxin